MERMVSIDASTSATGVAVFKKLKNGYKYEGHDLFTPEKFKYTKKTKDMTKTAYKTLHSAEKRQDMERRVLFMLRNIVPFLDKWKPSVVMIEDTYGQNDMMTYKMLCRIQGAVLDWARRNNAEIRFISPASWRKKVGIPQTDANKQRIKRNKLKELAKIVVHNFFEIDVTDDEADAICIGLSLFMKG